MLSYANLTPIPVAMHGFGPEKLMTYPYAIDEIEGKNPDSKYLVVIKVIDMESYQRIENLFTNDYAIEPQIKVSVYEATSLGSKEPELKEIAASTTESDERKKYNLLVWMDMKDEQVGLRREISYHDGTIDITIPVRGEEMKERKFSFKVD
jgi:hypothetical protein